MENDDDQGPEKAGPHRQWRLPLQSLHLPELQLLNEYGPRRRWRGPICHRLSDISAA